MEHGKFDTIYWSKVWYDVDHWHPNPLTMSLRISSWSLNMIRWRVVISVFRHDGKALFAANIAALNSSVVVKGTWETTCCVAYWWSKVIHSDCYYIDPKKKKENRKKFKYIFYTYRVYYINGGWWLGIDKSTTNEVRDPLEDIVSNELESSTTFSDIANMEKGG